MMKRFITIILMVVFVFSAGAVLAKGKKRSRKEQKAYDTRKAQYEKDYKNAEAQGKEVLRNFWKKTAQQGTDEENEWMKDLHYGKKDKKGKRVKKKKKGKKGFMGDPKDPGPQDWSDFIIKKDSKGNVIGFEEKDFEAKDTDGDGKISEDERKEWDKKKKEENDKNGGAPGEVPPIADWDKDGDGIADADYQRWCWQCVMPNDLNECKNGFMGGCDNGGSCDISERCIAHNETDNDRVLECHTCEYISEKVNKCGDGLKEGDCPGGCSENEQCVAVGESCYRCDKKIEICKSKGFKKDCQSCLSNEICTYVSVGEEKCVQCVERLSCRHYELVDNCNQCQKGFVCQPSKDANTRLDGTGEELSCYKCIDKSICEKQGLKTDCSSCNEKSEICESVSTDQGTCYRCQVNEYNTCDYYEAFPDCTQCNLQTHSCVPANLWKKDLKCYYCEEKGGCDEKGFWPESRCNRCKEMGGECVALEKTDKGEDCFKCIFSNMICEDLYMNVYSNGCSECPSGFSCESVNIGGLSCFQCVEKLKETCRDRGQLTFDECSQCIEEGGSCKMEKQDDYDTRCYTCENSDKQRCADGYSPGKCYPVTCAEGVKCTDAKMNGKRCHKCEEKEKVIGCQSDDDCDDGDMCTMDACRAGECINVEIICENEGECNPDTGKCESVMREPTSCYYRQQKDGGCTSQSCDSGTECKEFDYDGTKCHWCQVSEKITQCKSPARDGSCPGTCDGNQLCVGGQGPCHMCMNVERIEITYVIIIIESPFGRYVLDDKPGFGGFKASQVMALAKVNSVKGGLSTVTGMLGGGFNPLSAIGGSMDLKSMGQALSKGLSKGSKYGNNCFSKNFKESDLSQGQDVPEAYQPPKKKKKKRKKGQPIEKEFIPEGDFGKDMKKNMSTGGPIVACGSVGKQKALAIMDAAGKPIEVIFKDQLKKNPNAITEALFRAEGASQMVMSIRQQGIQAFLKQKVMSLGQKLADKTVKAIGNKITGEGKIIPNDPFYKEPEKKKKKKLFGILGSSKKVKNITGNPMRMGMGTLGGGSRESRKKELLKDQWGLHKIGYTPLSDTRSAWHAVDFQKKNVLVAVIDSGFDFEHEDAPQYTWTNKGEIANNGIDDDFNGYVDDVRGWNFLDNNNNLKDERGHGSFVAGIIAAKWNNGIGIAGINPGAVIMPIKVADKEGETNSFDIFRAINYAVDNGAQVINISLGSRGVSQMEHKALNYARAKGVFVAIASGNIGENIGEHGPASGNGGFAVGSIDHSGMRSTISNWGANNGLLAPGEQIYSLIATGTGKGLLKSIQKAGYYPQSGTSFSTPMVTATASLLLTKNPHLTPEDIEDILQRTATDMYDPGWDDKSGAGLLDASAALRFEMKESLTVKIAEMRINKNKKKKIESVDIFGTVRGEFDYFIVELGKGKRADKFKQVSKAFKKPASHDWLIRLIKKDNLRGSTDWKVRIKAIDKNGKEYFAEALLELK